MMFLDCPAFVDHDLTVRCALPAEVRCRFTMRSTDGPLECAMIRCPAGHHFNAPIESLTWHGNGQHDSGTTTADSRARRTSQGSGVGREGSTRSAVRDYRVAPTSIVSRPSTAPAYYLGRPAHVWMSATRPRGQTTCDERMQADSDGGRPAPLGRSEQVTSAEAEVACVTAVA